jgi:signal transduction histidine kinase
VAQETTEGPGARAGIDITQKRSSPTLWVAVLSILVALALLFALDRHLDRRFSQVSDAFSSQEQHVEKATAIRREARKAYVLMLESWLLPDAPRRAGQDAIQAAVVHVQQEAADLANLASIDTAEEPLLRGLSDHLFTLSSRMLVSSLSGEGPEGAPELERSMATVDGDVSAILDYATRSGGEASREIDKLRRQRGWLQGLFLVSVVVTIGAAFIWQQRLRERAKLAEVERVEHERSSRLQAQFFASVSHELRTPLVAIRGFASDVEEHPGVDDLVRERSRRIQEEAMSLLGMINNILDAAKIEAGEVQLELEDVALDGILERCVSRCQGLLRDKSVALDLEVPEGTPPVRADFVKLQQVFTNLIANAVKFTETGHVRVRVLREGAPEGKLAVEVEDTGIGIAKETLPHIWSPFRQADATVSRQYGGTGLGLSIVRGIVQLHGGSIDVRSTLGAGSTFTVLLPRGGGSGEPEQPS